MFPLVWLVQVRAGFVKLHFKHNFINLGQFAHIMLSIRQTRLHSGVWFLVRT